MKKRLFYLDFIRSLAVLAVLGCHFTRQMEYAWINFTHKVLPDYICNVYMGSFGVGLFFIISGASLMYVYSEKLELKGFLVKRFWAIYPMFWLAYIAAFLYNFYQNKGMDFVHPKWKYLLTLVGMDGYTNFYGQNYYLLGEWFLGCLIFLYLLFPLLRWGVKQYPVIIGVLAIIIFGLGSVYSYNNPYQMPPECWFFMRIPEMLVGMYFVEYWKRVRWPIAVLSLILLGVMQYIPIIPTPQAQILKTVPVCIAAFFVLVFISNWMEMKPLASLCRVVGKYSYAIFLSHHFIISKICGKFTGAAFVGVEVWLYFGFVLVFIGVISRLLFDANSYVVKSIKGFKNTDKG